MTKNALRKATMFLDLERVGFSQPLTDDVRPTESQSQKREKFLQPFFLSNMCFFQTEASRLQATEERFSSSNAWHNLSTYLLFHHCLPQSHTRLRQVLIPMTQSSSPKTCR